MRVGNLTAARDFTDVRDVVRAYRLLAELGAAGDVYNVCSGCAVPIATILAEILSLAAAAARSGRGPGPRATDRPADPPWRREPARGAHRLEARDPAGQTLVDVMRATREGV